MFSYFTRSRLRADFRLCQNPRSLNVFADIGMAAPEENLAKTKLAAGISGIIKRRKWTQAQAAAFLGIDQPKVSTISHGRLSGFSTDRLLKYLTALGSDIEIVIKDNAGAKKPWRIRISGV